MNTTSCDGCGVLLDKSKLKFKPEPEDLYYNEKPDGWMWDTEILEWIPYTECPVCSCIIRGDRND